MKLLLLALVLTASICIKTSEALACTANFCQLVDCMPYTSENCVGKIVKNGGMCGCCDACLKVLNPGDTCFSLILMGAPNTVTCPDNYHCDHVSLKCIANK
ncbi:uncharacterized protein LOC129921817 [Biomphalaria glabrata]|uniref:Uncharacterized protein LOC129921817 n=1 Tax=Biomphalaria glabrata TaxID=6526 RepID=A0A9W2YDS9_BIOGL|nr:uncharacterized protein LOC129921817 [Biomphalaria glabrata]